MIQRVNGVVGVAQWKRAHLPPLRSRVQIRVPSCCGEGDSLQQRPPRSSVSSYMQNSPNSVIRANNAIGARLSSHYYYYYYHFWNKTFTVSWLPPMPESVAWSWSKLLKAPIVDLLWCYCIKNAMSFWKRISSSCLVHKPKVIEACNQGRTLAYLSYIASLFMICSGVLFVPLCSV